MNLTINLATKVYINFKQVNLLLILAFLICSLWLSINVYNFAINLQQMNKYNSFLKKNNLTGQNKTVSDADYNKFLDTIKYANSIINKRSYNWLLLLDNLEKFVPPGVSLTSFQPSAKEDPSKLSGNAVSFGAVRRFMENLELSGVFTDIFLTQQSIVKLENKRQAISFSITFKATPL